MHVSFKIHGRVLVFMGGQLTECVLIAASDEVVKRSLDYSGVTITLGGRTVHKKFTEWTSGPVDFLVINPNNTGLEAQIVGYAAQDMFNEEPDPDKIELFA